MPVKADQLDPSKLNQHKPMDEDSRLAILGDWIGLGPALVSPGDILIGLAVAVLILSEVIGLK